MKGEVDTRPRKDPGASFVLDVGEPVVAAWVGEGCERVSEQELTGEAEGADAGLVMEAKERELDARNSSKATHLCKWALRPRMWLTLAGRQAEKGRVARRR